MSKEDLDFSDVSSEEDTEDIFEEEYISDEDQPTYEINEDEENEDDDENEDEEENEDNEQNEDDEENEDEESINEDEINEDDENFDDFDPGYEDDINESMILLDDEPSLKIKKKKEYNLKIGDVLENLKNYNYLNIEYSEFEKNIKNDMKKYILIKGEVSTKNIDILYKNIFECVLNELKIQNIELENIDSLKQVQTIKKRVLDKIRFIYYQKENNLIKDIQTLIKNKELWGNLKHSGSSFDTKEWDEYKEIIKKEVIKIKSPVEVIEGMYHCPKCGCNLTQSYNVQLRRADEPMTTFITCMNKICKHKWRKG